MCRVTAWCHFSRRNTRWPFACRMRSGLRRRASRPSSYSAAIGRSGHRGAWSTRGSCGRRFGRTRPASPSAAGPILTPIRSSRSPSWATDTSLGEFFLTQVVSHHDSARVDRLLEEMDRRRLGVPGVFGVFFYRSANPKTPLTLRRLPAGPSPAAHRGIRGGRHARRGVRPHDSLAAGRRRSSCVCLEPAHRPPATDAGPHRRPGLIGGAHAFRPSVLIAVPQDPSKTISPRALRLRGRSSASRCFSTGSEAGSPA